jgi:hypothetical protein
MAMTTTYSGRAAPSVHTRHVVAHRRIDVSVTRRSLQVALGGLWLIDAALQFQPHMFTRAFVSGTIAPAAQGNPAIIADPMHWVSQVMAAQPALVNAVFAVVQLLIAVGLLWQRRVKLCLLASIAWSLGVWWFGEGLGGVLSGASPYSGAPGAVILYALLALLVWPGGARRADDSVAESGILGRSGARAAWVVLWGTTAYLLVRLPNATPSMAHDMAASAAQGQPGWLASIDNGLASLFSGAGTETAIVLAAASQLVAVAIILPRLARAGVILGVALGGLLWLMQGLGGIFTGTGTDPNSGLLLAVIAVSFWPRRRRARSEQGAKPGSSALWVPSHRGHHTDAQIPGLGSEDQGGEHPPPRCRPARTWLSFGTVGLVAMASLLVTGVTAAQAASHGARAGRSPMGGMKMSSHAGGAAMPGLIGTEGISQSARMICAAETRHNIAVALGLSGEPQPTSSWTDHLYTCAYHLPEGTLVLSVKELGDDQTAQRYLDDAVRMTGDARPIQGLASLGLPGFETPTGVVMFRKDNKTLQVDAAGLPAKTGSLHLARENFAYQVATDILACWSGH